MTLGYNINLRFTIEKFDINIQKIDCQTLIIYGIVIIVFLYNKKLEEVWLMKKIFLLVEISIEVIFDVLLFIFFNVIIDCAKIELK